MPDTAAIDQTVLGEVIGRFPPEPSSVLPVLQAIQEEAGYVPEQAMRTMAGELAVPLVKIYALATFYKQIRLTPRGEHMVHICKGTACHVRGAQLIEDEFFNKLGLRPGDTTEDKKFTLEVVNCVGACSMAPVVVIDDTYHSNVRPDRATKLLDKVK